MFFDTHTHLGNRQFDADLPTVLERARAAGVSRMVAPAVDLENARKLLAIAEGQPDVRVAVGIHKNDIDSAVATYNDLSEGWYTHATPTLFNAGTPKPQMSSCFLLQLKDDSISGIYDA